VTAFCFFSIDLEISLQIALPTTKPSAFFRDWMVFSVIPKPITTFFDLFCFFINNGLLENQVINKQVIRSFGFDDFPNKIINKKLRIWNGFHPINGDKVLAVGDAASLCDPFLAEGIRPSLISSFYAAEYIDQCLSGKVDDLNLYTKNINNIWGKSMAWGRRIAQVFYRFPRTGYQLGVKRKTAPKRIAQILSGEMSYEDIAKRVIRRLLIKSGS